MYAISFMAVNKNAVPPPGETGSMVYWAHRAVVGIFESIEEAGRQNKEQVYRMFPVAEGYSLHGVVVTPIEREFFDALQQTIDTGVFVADVAADEKTRTFNFDVVNDFHFGTDGDIH